jgi:hypothetical protein
MVIWAVVEHYQLTGQPWLLRGAIASRIKTARGHLAERTSAHKYADEESRRMA